MTKNIIIIFLASMLCILGFHSCNLEESSSKQHKDLIEALLGNENLKKTIDSKNREITQVTAIMISKDKEVQKALKEIDRLKSLDAKIVFKTRTKYDTINMLLRDTTIIHDTDTIRSQKFDYKDQWLVMSGLVQYDSLMFDSLLINNKFSVEIGNIRKGLFKKQKVAFITNENPYTETTEAQTFILEDQKKWYDRGIVKFLAGGAVALVLFSL